MTPDRIRECLAALRWSQRGLADALGVHQTTARRWATGEGVIPANVAQWLEDLIAAHQAHPLPAGWHAREPVPEPPGSYSFGEHPDDFDAVNAGR